MKTGQLNLFEGQEQGQVSALDQLFGEARAYRSSREYLDLLRFIRRLPRYAPFNCFLLHMQNPGVRHVATPEQWRKRFGRRILDGARPLIILAPMSPVLFVYDATDTEGDPLPPEMLDPFKAKGIVPQSVWDRTLANCPRDLILVVELDMHPNRAGYIGLAERDDSVSLVTGKDDEGNPIVERRKAVYRLRLNSKQDRAAQYATLAHELAHLYCGHLGTPDEKWWPDRRHVAADEAEFEAESVAYLLCGRLGIQNPSARYLAGYLRGHENVPGISLNCVLGATGIIDRMGKEILKPRKKQGS